MLVRKMLRDIRESKGSYLACLVLTLLALMVYTSFAILGESLDRSQEQFYREQNFAGGFVELAGMPQARVALLEEVEGVGQVQGRLVLDVRVTDPQAAGEGVYLRLVSLDTGVARRLNDVLLLEGGPLEAGARQVWLESQFFRANTWEVGDPLRIQVYGEQRTVTVRGAGMSPEFTYPLRDYREIYPDPRSFGIAFMRYEEMTALFPDWRGQVNNVVFSLDGETGFETVRREIAGILAPYGVQSVYPRDEQISHVILDMEIENVQAMARVLPLMFLFIAGIILYIMLRRLTEQQRTQIGILKALGYTDREILLHYLSYGVCIGTVGGLAGGLLGLWLAGPLTALLLAFFAVPLVVPAFSWLHLLAGLLLSWGIFLGAGFQGCRGVLQLGPAEAVRPPVPPGSHRVFLERFPALWGLLRAQGRMALRSLLRNRGRTVFLFLGMTLSCAVVAVTWSLNDMTDKMLFYQYDEVEVYDARVDLYSPGRREPWEEALFRRPEVAWLEPHLEAGVRLHHRWTGEDAVVTGIPAGGELFRVLDDTGRRVRPRPDGIVLSVRLADKLGVGPGDLLAVESPWQPRTDDPAEVRVDAVIPQYLGMGAYMDLESLAEILGHPGVATTFLLRLAGTGEEAADHLSSLRRDLEAGGRVAGVDGSEERVSQTREMMDAFGAVIYLYVLIGVIMCFSIIYSSSFIILSERSRELASMMVLGMSSREVFSVITGEQWAIGGVAILAGLPLGQFLQMFFARVMSTDLFTVPAGLSGGSLLVAPLITALSVWVAQRFVLRKIGQLDLIDVLKSRE